MVGGGCSNTLNTFNFFIVSNTCIRMKNKTFLEIEDFFGLRPYVLNMLNMHL